MAYTMTVNGRELPLSDDEQSCAAKLQLLGCCCCLCTACLSWIPLCCYCCSMNRKYSYDAPVIITNTNTNTNQVVVGVPLDVVPIDGAYQNTAPQPQPAMGEAGGEAV
eukprot:GILI01029216.1.p1 GENE.GILI01029216.1~~GILI01029216.1.p1  ORF type:complete len:108 (-),score=4.09 GILI01029216.1:41-364(-)